MLLFLPLVTSLSSKPSDVLNIKLAVICPGSSCILMGEPFLLSMLSEVAIHYCGFDIFLLVFFFLSARHLLEAS